MFMLFTISDHVVIIIFITRVFVFDWIVFWNNTVSTTLPNVISED